MLRWTSGSETCGVLLRHPRSTSAAIVWFRWSIISKTDADSAERIDLVGGVRDADIASAMTRIHRCRSFGLVRPVAG